MTGWPLFFEIVGVIWTVWRFFDFIEWLDKPRRTRR